MPGKCHQRAASRNYDATARLREIGVATLILHGSRDRVAPLNLAQDMHAGIRNSVIERSTADTCFCSSDRTSSLPLSWNFWLRLARHRHDCGDVVSYFVTRDLLISAARDADPFGWLVRISETAALEFLRLMAS